MSVLPGGLWSQVELLTLEETLQLVVTHNLQVEAEQERLDSARANRRAEWGMFEPRLVVSYGKIADEKQNNVQDALARNPLFAEPLEFYDSHNDRLSVGIEQLLPTGGELRLGTDWTMLRNNLQERSEIDEEFESYAGISVRQPLLKGAGYQTTMARIRVAASQSTQTLHEVRRRLMAILSQAEVAYWELYRAERELGYRRDSVERARRLLEDNRSRLDAGRMSSVDVIQAEAALALRETQRAEAQHAFSTAVAQLRSFIGAEGEAMLILQAAEELDFEAKAPDFVTSMRRALENHPALGAMEEELNQAEIRKRVATNYRLPRLDFSAGYGVNGYGLGPRSNYEALVDGDYTSWYVGLELEVPIFTGLRERQQLIAARHDLRGAQANLDSIRIELSNLIRSTTDTIASMASQVEQYRNVVGLNERVLDAELSNLDSGRGDSRDVLRAEEGLTEARIALLRSMINYRQRLIDLEVLEGTYLEGHAMEISEEDKRS